MPNQTCEKQSNSNIPLPLQGAKCIPTQSLRTGGASFRRDGEDEGCLIPVEAGEREEEKSAVLCGSKEPAYLGDINIGGGICISFFVV